MIGIAEMFAEYAAADEYDVQYSVESFCWRQLEARKERNARTNLRRDLRLKANPHKADKRREYMRNYMREYDKRRRQQDPAYLEMRRRTVRESMARRYAAQRAA